MNDHREFYRKKLSSLGFILKPSGEVAFQLRDVSVDGFQGYFDQVPPLTKGDMVRVRLPSLHLEANATVIRIVQDDHHSTHIGYRVGFLFGERTEWDPNTVFIPTRNSEDEGL